ncbi:hypothetical protein M758_10G075700 [Ceratodon purpureus]|nr:hypothetical protein M758_10G075700 [Ceratodon purpureus]
MSPLLSTSPPPPGDASHTFITSNATKSSPLGNMRHHQHLHKTPSSCPASKSPDCPLLTLPHLSNNHPPKLSFSITGNVMMPQQSGPNQPGPCSSLRLNLFPPTQSSCSLQTHSHPITITLLLYELHHIVMWNQELQRHAESHEHPKRLPPSNVPNGQSTEREHAASPGEHLVEPDQRLLKM